MSVSLKAKPVTLQTQCQAEPALDFLHLLSPAQGTFHSPMQLCQQLLFRSTAEGQQQKINSPQNHSRVPERMNNVAFTAK